MSDSENPQDDGEQDRREGFEELSPSGRLRSRRRKHSGPYNAPIPEAADINSLRINWQSDAARLSGQAGQPNSPSGGRPPGADGALSDRATLEQLVRRLADELKAETEKPNNPNQLRHGEHPADKIPPPLPSSISVVNRQGLFDKSTGKRKRKREHGSEHNSEHSSEHSSGGRRHCPFCSHRRAVHIRPANPFARLVSILGIRTYSCRNCHTQFLAFSFVEGPYFTWRQLGIFGLILLIILLGFAFVYPLINRLPDPVE